MMEELLDDGRKEMMKEIEGAEKVEKGKMEDEMDTTTSVSSTRKKKSGDDRGHIELIIGPMFAGKTSEMIRRCRRYKLSGYSVVVIKHAKDTRYDFGPVIVTHDKHTLDALPLNSLEEKDLKRFLEETDVVAIDECHFFHNIADIADMLAFRGKIVILAGLDAQNIRQGFKNVLEVVPLAEQVLKLTSVCEICLNDGSYTKRRAGVKDASIVVGGKELYSTVCRKCYFLID